MREQESADGFEFAVRINTQPLARALRSPRWVLARRIRWGVELTQLRYLIAIADAGHMTRAAEALGVTQPALSAMLRKVEGEVGAELFHRTGRGVEPTAAGLVFIEHARDAVRRADAGVLAVQELVGLRAGSIRVGGGATAITYLLPSVVSTLRRDHPALRFYVREAGSNVVAAAVLRGELDLGIVTLPISVPGHDDLQEIDLIEDEFRLIVPPGHRLGDKRSFRFADLQGEAFVAFEGGSAVRDVVDRAAQRAGASLHVVMELRSIESIKSMVDAGVGVGLISRLALPARAGLPCKDERLVRRLAIVRRQGRLPSPAAAAFETLLLESARRVLGGRTEPRA